MPTRADELREAVRLAVDATLGVTDVVQKMHHTIGGGPALLGRPFEGLVKLLSAPAYAGVRFVTQLVGTGLDSVLEQLAPVLGERGGDEQDFVLGVLNGVVGDRLVERGSSLAMRTELRRRGQTLPAASTTLGPVTGRLLVVVHGSSATDGCWARKGRHHGDALEQKLGLACLTLRYNSGLHVSTNGRAFASELEKVVTAWPVPVAELVVVAHSMGGLVTRSACAVAEAEGLRWRGLLRRIVFLGTPHQGAPLERIGNVVGTLLGVSRYSAPLTALAQLRSAGVTDLRFGLTRDDEWQGADRFALEVDPRKTASLPKDVECFAIAATTAKDVTATSPGDGLVPIDSALGRHARPELTLAFTPAHTAVLPDLNHQDLLSDPRVEAQLVEWLRREPESGEGLHSR